MAQLDETQNALARARYAALDKIVRGTQLREAGERELASVDSMIALCGDLAAKQPEASGGDH